MNYYDNNDSFETMNSVSVVADVIDGVANFVGEKVKSMIKAIRK